MKVFPSSNLVAIEGSEDAALAIKAATDLSVRAGSELHVVHTWRRPSFLGYYPVGEAENSDIRKEAERLLERQAEQAQAARGTVAGSHLREGRPAEEVAGLTGELGVGLVVVGSRAPGLRSRAILHAWRRRRRRFEGRGRPGFDRSVAERRTTVMAQRFTEGMNRG